MASEKSRKTSAERLTTIKGIGEETAKRLYELGIRNYAELSECKAKALVESLKSAKVRAVTQKQVADWQRQAKKLMGNKNSTTKKTHAPIRPFHGEATGNNSGWATQGTFVVEFQSQAGIRERILCQHHESSAQQEWGGEEYSKVCRWMYDLMHQPIEKNPGTTHSKTGQKNIANDSVRLGITRVQAFQSENKQATAISNDGSGFHGVLNSHQPIAFEICFELLGDDAVEFVKRGARYTAELYACSRNTSVKTHLSSLKPRIMDQSRTEYSIVLPETELASGCYRLECIIDAGKDAELEGNLMIPFLRVA